MNRHGFTIVELLIVIGLAALLMSLATLDFGSWQRKSGVERYTKELYGDLQDARMKAAFTKVRQGVQFNAQQVVFLSYSSENDVGGTTVTTKNLPISFTTSTTNEAWTPANRINFDTRGIMIDPVIKVVCFTTTENASYDALIITPALTSMGKVTDRGSACARTNVTQK